MFCMDVSALLVIHLGRKHRAFFSHGVHKWSDCGLILLVSAMMTARSKKVFVFRLPFPGLKFLLTPPHPTLLCASCSPLFLLFSSLLWMVRQVSTPFSPTEIPPNPRSLCASCSSSSLVPVLLWLARQVSAHFFCRRCGVHVVHAPDFPHAAVADVNVHCILPDTIKSLAVGFLRGGGGELPGMGDPIEDMYEVRAATFLEQLFFLPARGCVVAPLVG